MKKIYICLLFPLLLTSCGKSQSILEKMTYKNFVATVKNQQENQKDLFVFTSSTCFHCKKITPLLERYVTENEKPISIHTLSLDISKKSGKTVFDDSSMGSYSGNSADDAIKQLDNRLFKMIVSNNISQGVEQLSVGHYAYISTPLFIWYENGLEKKVMNSIEDEIKDNDDSLSYDKLLKIIEDFDTNYNWTETFNLEYFN